MNNYLNEKDLNKIYWYFFLQWQKNDIFETKNNGRMTFFCEREEIFDLVHDSKYHESMNMLKYIIVHD